ncbi:PLP-dependent cysteine synthase family protein [Geobacter pickeringii]|uniref:cysteine synthase n=1 Tax=Geobacter pickeringii TaxID=345632 RepID=A0A0B5BCL3_9BACT|nr:cysteine synthase family protein [Geobacter pickeringii]AJE02310.1 cysteine synthase [Geobacter pickeringii]
MTHPPFSLARSIGATPLVELRHLNPNPRVRILAKLEGNNVGGSVKDRPALYMLTKAEEGGELTSEKTILEPTSGNTGIALAMLGTARGYRVKLVMPACVSLERRAVLEAYGAELVLSPAEEATDGAILLAHRILGEEPDRYYMPNQYANPHNPLAHYETTAPEIDHATGGSIDFFVAGMGTGGTLMGVSRYFREKKPGVGIVGVEPRLGHRVQGLKNMQEAIVPAIYDPAALDLKLTVQDEPAFETARELAGREGLFVGMSSGAAVAGAIQVATDAPAGSTIVVLLPDRGDRYLSTSLFRSVCGNCPP